MEPAKQRYVSWCEELSTPVLTLLPAPRRKITMKQWRIEEAARRGVPESTIAIWIHRGKYPNLKTVRVNKRVVFVIQ